jgi:putative transposase
MKCSLKQSQTFSVLLACYGVRRVHAELLHGLGIQVGRDQVALVMSRLGLRGISGTRKRCVNREHLIMTEDLVERNFTATAPNQLWCTDITDHPTREGKHNCCYVLRLFDENRRLGD